MTDGTSPVRYFRDEREARREGPLRHRLARDAQEGYRLVGPDGALTPVIADVMWVDNHPAGPDTHVFITFEDFTSLDFEHGAQLTMVWHAEERPIEPADLAAATPVTWGTPVPAEWWG